MDQDFEGTYTLPIFTDLPRLAAAGEVCAWLYAVMSLVTGIQWLRADGSLYVGLTWVGASFVASTATVAFTRYIRWSMRNRSLT